MANDSTTTGFVSATSSNVYDIELDRLLQTAVVGISGLPGQLVRPRWQAITPNQPEHEVNWCAIGVSDIAPDAYTFKTHDPAGQGTDIVERDEILTVLASFYGLASNTNAHAFYDGLQVNQNRDTLAAAGIVLITVGECLQVPVLLAQKWARRVDITVTLRRRTQRVYQIKSLVSASVELDNASVSTLISIHP